MPGRAWNTPLVGRTAELATLDEAMNAAADGTPAVVLLAGEAGIGKSRLTAEVSRRAVANGWQVLSGGCLDLTEAPVPYLPLVDALHELSIDALPQVLTHWLQGEADESPTMPSGEAARGRVYAAYLEELRTASAESPVVLVVEDLHWADRATRDLLSYLIRGLTAATARARILLVLTYRSDEFPRGSDVRRWLGELARRPSVTRMVLAPFDQAEVRQQLATLGKFDSHSSREIFLRSEGNPFYVEELAAAWTTGQTAVPEVVRDAAELRVSSLSAGDLDVVRLLAALGRPATFELVLIMSGRPPPELLATLRRAVDARLFTIDVSTGTYRFRHSLLAEAVISDFLPGEQAVVHQAIARSLADDPALATGPGEIGFHQQAAGELDAALASYIAAADAAARVYAFGDAGRFLERALELWSQVPDASRRAGEPRANLLSRAADFIARAGDFDRATALARATLTEPEITAYPERQAEVWVRIAWYRLMASDGPGLFGAYESAAAALESALDTHGRARLAADHAMARAIWGRNEEALAEAERALALADAEGDLGARGLALNARGCVRSSAGDSEDALRDHEEALDLAHSYGTPQDVCRATLNFAVTLARAGRDEEALALSEVGISESISQGLVLPYAALCRSTAADALFALGRWDDAASHIEAVLVLIDVGEAARMAKGLGARIAAARGDSNLARRLLSEVPRQGRERDEPQLVAPAWLALAELCAWSDLFEEGSAAVAAGLDLVVGMDPWLTVELCAVGIRLEADRRISAHRRRAGSEEAASQERARELWMHAGDLGSPNGPVGAWLAQAHAEFVRSMGRDRNTGQLLAEWTAVRNRWRALGHPYQEAYADLRLAESHLGVGERQEAEAALRRSASIAEKLRARPLAALVTDVAQRGGLDSTPGSAKDGLTAREREILDWVAQGASDRDIADALFISPKTVSVHVSALLRKFGVSGRGDLRRAQRQS